MEQGSKTEIGVCSFKPPVYVFKRSFVTRTQTVILI